MSKVLYFFITHKNNIDICYDRITNMMKRDYVIVVGGYIKNKYIEDRKILQLDCNDDYIGLPEKVIKSLHFISTEDYFSEYTHFCKLDDDMIVVKKFENLTEDYIGNVHYTDGNRSWHIGRLKNNIYNKIPYQGEFKPWCMGGFGYVVSRKSIEKIVPNHEYLNHIYEDVYIGILMNEIGVVPTNIKIRDFLKSPEH